MLRRQTRVAKPRHMEKGKIHMAATRFVRRLIFRGILLLAVLLVIAAGVAWLMVDRLAKSAVERGGTYALGVDTQVQGVDLSLLGGTLRMDGMNVSNPEGYNTPHAMKFDRFDFAIDTGSILGDPVRMHNIELRGMEINIEQKLLKTNIGEILENVRRFQSKSPEEKREEGSGTRIAVDRLVIHEVTAHFHVLGGLVGQGEPITIVVPRIELEGLTHDNAKGMFVGELFARVIPAIIEQVLTQAEGKVSLPTLEDLRGKTSQAAEAMGGIGEQLFDHMRQEADRP